MFVIVQIHFFLYKYRLETDSHYQGDLAPLSLSPVWVGSINSSPTARLICSTGGILGKQITSQGSLGHCTIRESFRLFQNITHLIPALRRHRVLWVWSQPRLYSKSLTQKGNMGGVCQEWLIIKGTYAPSTLEQSEYSIILVDVNRAIKKNILPHKQELSGILPVWVLTLY